MTKRISSLFLAALVLLSLTVTAFAAPSVSGVGVVVGATVSGSAVTVEVSVTGAGSATNGRIEVTYDPTLYALASAEPAGLQWIASVSTAEEGKVHFAWVGSDLPSDQTSVVTLVFQANGTPSAAVFTASVLELYQNGTQIIGEDTDQPTDSERVTPPASTPSGPEPSKPSEPSEPSDPPQEKTNPFEDIDGSWARDVILDAYYNGWILGTTATTYEPDLTADRGQFATIMWRVAGSPNTASINPFTDVKSSSYYEIPINWGCQIGMIKGTSETTASPEKNITRQEAVVMLYRYAVYTGGNTSERGSLSEFSDQDSVSDWARDAVAWAVHHGIIQGTPGKLLEPARDITRSEMAAIIVRFTAMAQGR